MRIKKTSATTPTQAQVINSYSTSTTDSYSANYVNTINTYSTDEIRIGTWLNKPLYRKVLTANTLANNTTLSINHNISNIDKVTLVSYSWYDTIDQKWYEGIRWDSATTYVRLNGVTSTSVSISCTGVDWSSRTSDVSIVLEYTKTTD